MEEETDDHSGRSYVHCRDRKEPGPAIRSQKVHAICCTGANLEEELFGLFSRSEYEHVPNWRHQSKEEDAELHQRGMNRVTDVAIPESTFTKVGDSLMSLWEESEAVGDSRFPHEYVYDLLLHGISRSPRHWRIRG